MTEFYIFRQRILLTFRGLLQAAGIIRPSVEPSVSVKSFHIRRKMCGFLPPNEVTSIVQVSFRNGPYGKSWKGCLDGTALMATNDTVRTCMYARHFRMYMYVYVHLWLL